MDAVEACSVCELPLSTRVIMPCGHSEICLECFVRLVKIYNRHQCYFCQRDLAATPVASKRRRRYEDAVAAATSENKELNLRYVEPEISEEACNLFRYHCSECGALRFGDESEFERHMQSHGKVVCGVCRESGRFLPCETPVFARELFAEHTEHHPKCPCCGLVAFDTQVLEHHMPEQHERCGICLKLFKVTWLKDTEELVEHCQREHFLCHYPECSSQGLIAFATHDELLMHLRDVHREKRGVGGQKKRIEEPVNEEERRARTVELDRRFKARCQSLISDPEVLQDLQRVARALLFDDITCNQFYEEFSALCGDKKNALFTDMVAILPDRQKRGQLLRLHENVRSARMSMPKSQSMPEVQTPVEQKPVERQAEAPPRAQPGRKRQRPKKVVLYTT